MAAMATAAAAACCGLEEETVTGEQKAPGACPRCGGAVVATDVESERWILCLPLCLKSKRKYSCSRCLRRLVTLYS
jgi:ribosomal protein S27AE